MPGSKRTVSPYPPFLAVPRLTAIPWLLHGFGTAGFREEDLGRRSEAKKFSPVILNQVHSDIVRRLERPVSRRLRGDALLTRAPGLLLVIKTADCLPVLLVDEEKRAVAAVHCGWRGTLKKILEKVVRELKKYYATDPAGLLAAFGPCIGPGCYEVGPEVRALYGEAGFPDSIFTEKPEKPGKYFLDLREANRRLLRAQGVRDDRIFALDTCAHCDPRFLSYRRDRDKNRRMSSFIGIRQLPAGRFSRS